MDALLAGDNGQRIGGSAEGARRAGRGGGGLPSERMDSMGFFLVLIFSQGVEGVLQSRRACRAVVAHASGFEEQWVHALIYSITRLFFCFASAVIIPVWHGPFGRTWLCPVP